MFVRIINHGSPEYENMIDLRLRVLLQPIGVPASYINHEKEKEDILIGAFEQDALIGCCVLTRINDTTIQLRQMAVCPHLHRKGTGKAIIKFTETLLREKGYRVLMMHARDAVTEFYKKCGYVVNSDLFYEVGIGHYKMEKKL